MTDSSLVLAQVIVLRAVQTEDFMTADWFPFPTEVLRKISSRITNEVNGVVRSLPFPILVVSSLYKNGSDALLSSPVCFSLLSFAPPNLRLRLGSTRLLLISFPFSPLLNRRHCRPRVSLSSLNARLEPLCDGRELQTARYRRMAVKGRSGRCSNDYFLLCGRRANTRERNDRLLSFRSSTPPHLTTTNAH
jgi:hypothetical protein